MILVEYIVIVLPVVEVLFDDNSKEKIFNTYQHYMLILNSWNKKQGIKYVQS